MTDNYDLLGSAEKAILAGLDSDISTIKRLLGDLSETLTAIQDQNLAPLMLDAGSKELLITLSPGLQTLRENLSASAMVLLMTSMVIQSKSQGES